MNNVRDYNCHYRCGEPAQNNIIKHRIRFFFSIETSLTSTYQSMTAFPTVTLKIPGRILVEPAYTYKLSSF